MQTNMTLNTHKYDQETCLHISGRTPTKTISPKHLMYDYIIHDYIWSEMSQSSSYDSENYLKESTEIIYKLCAQTTETKQIS